GFGIGDDIELPFVPLSDGAGEVVEVGKNVSRVQPGDKVNPLFFQEWLAGQFTAEVADSSLAGGRYEGILSEYVCLNENGVSKYPQHLTAKQAATLPCTGVTAWSALSQAGVKAGDIVLLQGTGGVSTQALKFAKAFGAEVIITSSSHAKLERVKTMGVDHLINYRDRPDWASEVAELTGGRGVDIVLDVGGAETLQQSIRAVKVGGVIAVVGVLSGAIKDLVIPELMFKAIRLQGISIGSREHYQDMVRAIELHGILPEVDKVFPMEQTSTALTYLQLANHVGKVVIDIEQR
ncbi:MAG: NAD(P)-dependent alcohol dehydrogenase, partial [Leptolyngbya sp. SIO1D8]|nr:NAD(P)-dependent alcohol dehydrogenase [Leptolyngbya sp. SIO1D8]